MKIICIGRNYADHAKELNNKVPTEPMFFCKPDSSILPNRNPLFIPEWTNDLHFEVELIVKINRLGKYIEEKHAHKYYDQVGLGIDFTARDVQQKCKEKGHPWEKAKAFDGSAVVSRKFLPLDQFKGIQDINFHLEKNGEKVQVGNTSDMIFSVDQIIAHVSQFMTLKMGDLIFTGTPAGVGPVAIDDKLEGFLEDQWMFKVPIK
ncbi:fumarylacetoacetate hydrolase family protein [Sanyastnella coralliicola]|uniref:fumarylacetoacetate hydrolase family protein n=1 Tax=Sanyastnella coralliicola TaxID=3069118 RepID=UPI0027B98809|nr:fumarylacetoacetate hydrolase family protein [Longitalea sp. SCSIO 12813]